MVLFALDSQSEASYCGIAAQTGLRRGQTLATMELTSLPIFQS
jgi:hypothetical protein